MSVLRNRAHACLADTIAICTGGISVADACGCLHTIAGQSVVRSGQRGRAFVRAWARSLPGPRSNQQAPPSIRQCAVAVERIRRIQVCAAAVPEMQAEKTSSGLLNSRIRRLPKVMTMAKLSYLLSQ
jgi:hypothetical protein